MKEKKDLAGQPIAVNHYLLDGTLVVEVVFRYYGSHEAHFFSVGERLRKPTFERSYGGHSSAEPPPRSVRKAMAVKAAAIASDHLKRLEKRTLAGAPPPPEAPEQLSLLQTEDDKGNDEPPAAARHHRSPCVRRPFAWRPSAAFAHP